LSSYVTVTLRIFIPASGIRLTVRPSTVAEPPLPMLTLALQISDGLIVDGAVCWLFAPCVFPAAPALRFGFAFPLESSEADAVVFSMPVYWYSIPAQIKGVIDKMFSLVVGGKDIAGKECALITCCEEEDMSVMDGVRIPIERTAALIKWKMVGEVLVPGVLEAGAIAKTDGCAQAAALADRI
jgi:hypothetical protein